MPANNKKIAIVHDWLYGGGAEKVVEALHELYPYAPIYTSYCSDEWRTRLDNKVVTGYLQRWPFSKLRKFLPLLRIRWFQGLDLSNFDVVISSTGNGEAKHIRTKPGTIHICYTHTPVHFYWRHYNEYIKRPGFKPVWLARLGLKLLVRPLRRLDYEAAQKVDVFIANSTHIQLDIKAYYNRDSVVVHPPVDIDKFNSIKSPKTQKRHGFVIWGRHVPMKRIDIAIEACSRLKLPLTVIGQGPDTLRLKSLASPIITFAGRLSDDELVQYAHASEAFLFPSFEDFGIAPVEAMAAGLPVIALNAGGALDYVQPGKTGELFDAQTPESLMKTLKSFNPGKYNSRDIKQTAQQFSKANFQKSLQKVLSITLQ